AVAVVVGAVVGAGLGCLGDRARAGARARHAGVARRRAGAADCALAIAQVARRAALLAEPRVLRAVVGQAVAVVVDPVAELLRRTGRAVAHQRGIDARGGAGDARALAVADLAHRAVLAARHAGVGEVVVDDAVAVVVEAVAGFGLRRLALRAGQAARTRARTGCAHPGRGADALGVDRR